MKVQHIADTWAKNVLSDYPTAHDIYALFKRDTKSFGSDWPDWCPLPMAATYAILTQDAQSEAQARSIIKSSQRENALPILTAALIWSNDKIIIKYDETLQDDLMRQPLNDKIPIEALMQLPYNCVYIDVSLVICNERTIGFFAWMEYDINAKMPELRILYLKPDNNCISIPIPLSGGTLDDSFHFLSVSATVRGETDYTIPQIRRAFASSQKAITSSINLILYLIAHNADYPAEAKTAEKRARYANGNVKRATVWDIGTRIGAAMRKSKASESVEHRRSEINLQRNSPRPHTRRAHWHHYWTGQGDDKKLIIKWLPPISVNFTDEAAMPATIIPIKK